eukprot:TRINITY_DN12839_c0_g1_i1.p1 TRINITY_DN12839_c0_g1~~TRINITY_DN12839_c0_g1_i1.p1  ORF type:complete len:465 (+),score=121.41 TRINITY_DN12839_c0_g1_i1:17-1411(+)
MATTHYPISLKYLYIYNPEFGPREDRQEDKILYYYPNDYNLGLQIRNIGLCEAMINMSKTFSDEPCSSIHTQKCRTTIIEPEPDFWMVLTVNNPSASKISKEGKEIKHWKEDEIDDEWLSSIAKQAYKMFRLFYGPMNVIVEENGGFTEDDNTGVLYLREILQNFFNIYVNYSEVENYDMFTTLDGIQFLPVDQNIFLRIQSFINLIINAFQQIEYVVFLYQDQIVWSGLEQNDIQVLYRYLIKFLGIFGDGTEDKFIPVNRPDKTNCGFITGPQSLDQNSNTFEVPTIFLGNEDALKELYLVIFQKKNITCLLLFKDEEPKDIKIYKQIYSLISSQVDNISIDIYESQNTYLSKNNKSEDIYCYIYFNHMNLAIKTSLDRKGKTINITKDTMRILNQMHYDFENSEENLNEIIVRTAKDRFIVGKKAEHRELYFISEDKKNLIEVTDEIKRLNLLQFNNIFID